MKIESWENLDGFSYQKSNGTFRKNNHTYHLKDCNYCGHEFFGYKNSIYCDNKCSPKSNNSGMKNKKHSTDTIKILKEKWLDKNSIYNNKEYREKLVNKKSNNGNWKGGITKENVVLYNTYAPQLEWCEEVRNDHKWLEVKCTYCGKWYKPTRSEVSNRLQFLKDNRKYNGEFRFYCSDECKHNCCLYGLSERDLLSKINRNGYDLYKGLVQKYTRINYNKYNDIINPNGLERRRHKYHLDHKYSIKSGFENGILPNIIGSYVNLIMLKEYDNISKSNNCSISSRQLYDLYNRGLI